MTLLLLLAGQTDYDVAMPAGEFTLTGAVPVLELIGDVDLAMPAGQFTLQGAVPTLEGLDYDVTMPAGSFSLAGAIPDLDLEGIVWLSTSSAAPRDLVAAALSGLINWEGHHHVLRLYGAGLDFSESADAMAADLNDELPTAGNYIAGGIEITDRSLDQSGEHWRLLSADAVIASATFSVRYVALIDDETGVDATSPVLSVYDLGGLWTLGGEPFVFSPDDTDGWGYGIS